MASKKDGKFFSSKKGEISELKDDLNSTDRQKIKDAVKKVIANMTVGKDVSGLFMDVIKSIQTDNIELKKLVYLYVINYARTQPEQAILVVNTFQKDAADKSPLIRALAIRTMGCIRVDRIIEYLCEPLNAALRDKDPYVRKTAAICVAKLYDINHELVEEQGFIQTLRDLISDPNPTVVANAVAALSEIAEASGKDVFQLNSAVLQKLLNALNECTEWGQVFLLDCLAKYEPSSKEAEEIIERVVPRLKHANAAVVMSAVKVIMRYLDFIKNPALDKQLCTEKLPPPLVTLLSEHRAEIQYVALRNINLIVQKRPEILSQSIKHFFCKYNDPIYVKMEKLEIMVKLANNSNIDKVLLEFKEYATEADVEFVRKAVAAIGRCAIKLDQAAERCIKVLLDLIQTKIDYVVQEAIIVVKDIFRRYPNKYESVIAQLCENLESLDEPEAKASMIWIIGEYADRIDNAPELLNSFLSSFEEESTQVQLTLLTATVKLFLKRPEDAKDSVTKVLKKATENSENPDLRDRGYVYWRLLATDPAAAQKVVLAERPVISDDAHSMDEKVLDTLITNISTLASVYHKPAEFFVKDQRTSLTLRRENKEDDEDEDEDEDNGEAEDDEDEAEDEKKAPLSQTAKATAPTSQSGAVVDLFGMMNISSAPVTSAPLSSSSSSSSSSALFDPFGFSSPTPAQQTPQPQGKVVIAAADAKGFQLRNTFTRKDGKLHMDLVFENKADRTLSQFAIKFNDNFAGLTPSVSVIPVSPVAVNSYQSYSLIVTEGKQPSAQFPIGLLQVAIKTEVGVFYFNENIPIHLLFDENGTIAQADFLNLWRTIDVSKEKKATVAKRSASTPDQVVDVISKSNCPLVARRDIKNTTQTAAYFSTKLRGQYLLFEIKVDNANTQAEISVKAEDDLVATTGLQAIQNLLQ